MSIVIENSFAVDASPERTFALMSDIERVCPCIPGAELLGVRDDGGYDVRVKMKMGPMNLSYNGSVLITDSDAGERRATLQAQATEQRGQGTASAELSMAVAQNDGAGSQVAVRSEMLITGRVGQMGRGIVVDVANRMISEMARAINATLADATTTPGGGTSPASAPDGASSGESDDGSLPAGAEAFARSSRQPPPGPVVRAQTPRLGRLFWQILWARMRRLVGLGSADGH